MDVREQEGRERAKNLVKMLRSQYITFRFIFAR
jgi:hypothetical protein